MRIQLLDAPGGAAVDVLDMLLFGDLNGDGYINNNDSSMAFNYISNNSDYLSDDNDDTEYSLSYIAGLVKDVAYEADNVITGTPDINNNDVNAIFKHIEGEDININYYQASLFY